MITYDGYTDGDRKKNVEMINVIPVNNTFLFLYRNRHEIPKIIKMEHKKSTCS